VTAARPTTSWQLPSVLVLAVVATGLVLATQVGWQTGTRVLGLAFLLAAVLRLSLPARSAGWLVVSCRVRFGSPGGVVDVGGGCALRHRDRVPACHACPPGCCV